MEKIITILCLVSMSLTSLASDKLEIISCQNKDETVKAKIAVSKESGSFGEAGGFLKSDSFGMVYKSTVKPISALIIKDDENGTASGSVVRADGMTITILASEMKKETCSGCAEGFKRNYKKATAVLLGNYEGYIKKNDIECSLDIEELK